MCASVALHFAHACPTPDPRPKRQRARKRRLDEPGKSLAKDEICVLNWSLATRFTNSLRKLTRGLPRSLRTASDTRLCRSG